jgi:Raf kinase inhibitor-like YbhB/YbcL family protein
MDLRRLWFLGCGVFLLTSLIGMADEPAEVSISTPAFKQGDPIPVEYAKKGQNISPELRFGTVPDSTKSLALIVDDLDAPTGIWNHWLVWNLPPDTTTIPEGKLPPGAVQGKNSFGNVAYDGPVPPSGTHRYFFHVYALDAVLTLSSGVERADLDAAMKGHIVGRGVTFGVYSASQ